MAAFFANNRGRVFRVNLAQQQGPTLFNIRMAGMDIGNGNASAKALINQAAIVEQGNYQFQHTCDNTIYAYIFGNRIGDLQVSGIAFAESCTGVAETGMDQVLRNYRSNGIAAKGRPVIVSYGVSSPFRAFLVGLSLDIVDAEQMFAQWSMRFKTFPGR